ncbi:MAG TPA: hypothetical protein VFZ66_29835 [Herpetosiphonaceae bacterium]
MERLSDLVDGNDRRGVEGIRTQLNLIRGRVESLHKDVAPVPQIVIDMATLKTRIGTLEDERTKIRYILVGMGLLLTLIGLVTGDDILTGIARLLGAP